MDRVTRQEQADHPSDLRGLFRDQHHAVRAVAVGADPATEGLALFAQLLLLAADTAADGARSLAATAPMMRA